MVSDLLYTNQGQNHKTMTVNNIRRLLKIKFLCKNGEVGDGVEGERKLICKSIKRQDDFSGII